MRPHTHTLPKTLLNVAGKPILGHIIDDLIKIDIKDIILIVGYMAKKVEHYCSESYPDLNFTFVHQKKRLGLGHAIGMAEPHVDDEPVLIIYGDTIFLGDISQGKKSDKDGYIGVKNVFDPRKYGVVETTDGVITKLVEKPDIEKEMPAIVGVNYINNSKLLFKCINELVEKDIKTKNEYQLTDAFQLMVEKGARLGVFDLEGWFDCGKPDTLLETNAYLLNKDCANNPNIEDCVTIPPVYIDPSAKVTSSIVGPNVAIAKDSIIKNSIIRDSIINQGSDINNAQLTHSIIGENATVHDTLQSLNVGDNSEVKFE